MGNGEGKRDKSAFLDIACEKLGMSAEEFLAPKIVMNCYKLSVLIDIGRIGI
ncbi:MAG: hypothetical protein LBH57_02705 [Treponema sp.]|jgi:hypothetical protein|nr:hypothetical protein [Treponema sp.]